jgi:hypothetical protein
MLETVEEAMRRVINYWGDLPPEAVKTGVFRPTPSGRSDAFRDLRAIVGQAVTALEAFTPDEVH